MPCQTASLFVASSCVSSWPPCFVVHDDELNVYALGPECMEEQCRCQNLMLESSKGFVCGMIALLVMTFRPCSLVSSELKTVNPHKSVTVHKDEPPFSTNCPSNHGVRSVSLFATTPVAFDYRDTEKPFWAPPSLSFWINSHLYESSQRRGLRDVNDFQTGKRVQPIHRKGHWLSFSYSCLFYSKKKEGRCEEKFGKGKAL